MINHKREKILNQPAYWIEGINGQLYNAIVQYMEQNKLNRTRLASHLGISKGRVSQILNDGDINFSIEKIIEIALKIDMFPVFEFVSKKSFIQKEQSTLPTTYPSHPPYNQKTDEINNKRPHLF